MRAIRTAAVVALAFLAACADQDVNQLTAPPSVAVLPAPALSLAGQTSDSAAIEGLILQLYSNLNGGDGPLNSAQTRFRQVAALYTNCNLNPPTSPCNQAGAQDNTYNLITDIFARYKADGLNALPSYSSASGAQAALDTIDTAISDLSEARSTLGASQNRLMVTVTNLATAHENLSAANSRIRDVDVASESSQLTKSQILSQAGVAVLSQANQLPQSALSLLR